MLEISDITVQFGGVRPLDSVSLSFQQGVSGLVGPNGAGKTTMLNVVSGFVTPVSGSVVFEGTDLLQLAPAKRARWGLRRTFQQEQVIQELSAVDNLRLAADNLRAGAGAVESALAFVGLEDPGRPATQLNMLERRLVEIGKVVIGEPKVVALDEPGAGLSEDDTKILVPLIKKIADEYGATVVLIDHDMDLVKTVCTEIAVLDFGKRIAFGKTADVLADPIVKKAYLGVEDVA